MAVKQFLLDLIDDNPHNPRKYYPQAKVKEMAQSLKEVGLRQIPEGRAVDGRVQLAYGHMRHRGFRYNLTHKEPGDWTTMPIDVKEISDQDMFHFAWEENMRRTDVTPLEFARCIEAFSQMFPDILDEDIAKKHGMSAANVSNMKRVLRLPEKIQEKIDAGTISFTQGRELLIFEDLENGENLMKTAIEGLKIGNRSYGESNTVEGLQKSIHGVFQNHYRPLDKKYQGYHWDILFDTRASGCLQCNHMVKTHPTKTEIAHFCVNDKCWDEHQQKQHDEAAAEAKKRMEDEISKRAIEAEAAKRAPQVNISQEKSAPAKPAYTLEKRGTSWIAIDNQGTIIAIDRDKTAADAWARASFKPVVTKINPSSEEYVLNHTYRISRKWELRSPDDIFDVTAKDLATAVKALGVNVGDIEAVRVFKSSGKLGTGGGVSAGWSKCTESLDGVKIVEEELEARADERDQALEEVREKANLERPAGEVPCETCAKGKTCDRSDFYADTNNSGRLICDTWEVVQTEAPAEVLTKDIPADVLEQAKKAAGTRSEVLDVHPLYSDAWRHELKGGYVLLNDVAREMDDPQECSERCVNGFHYAFDSGHLDRTGLCVCTDPKCVTKKKSALTRKKNAEGQIRKKAEQKAIQEAVQGANNRPRGLMMLVIYTQVKRQASYYSSGIKSPETWLWDKLSAGTKESERSIDALMDKVDKLDVTELQKLVVEFMFSYLTDHGDVGSYEIRTEMPLHWFGIELQFGDNAR